MSISVEPTSLLGELSDPSTTDKSSDGAKVPENRWTNAFYPSPLAPHDKTSKNVVIVMRCEENVADAFGPNWSHVATHSGKYQSFDLNMPVTMPALAFSSLKLDPPLSVLGRFSTIARAKSMKHQRIKVDTILTPPALRCVQMAAAFISVYNSAQIVVVPDLMEPEVVSEYGILTTVNGKYMKVNTLRKIGLDVRESAFTESQIVPDAPEIPLSTIKRIHDAIVEIISKVPGGPLLIIGDCVVLKVAESMASIPDGFTDLLADKPFKMPNFTDKTNQEVSQTEFDFTELREHYPYGATSVFRKNRNGERFCLSRLPVALHAVTVHPNQQRQTHLLAEATESNQQEPLQSGSEIAVN